MTMRGRCFARHDVTVFPKKWLPPLSLSVHPIALTEKHSGIRRPAPGNRRSDRPERPYYSNPPKNGHIGTGVSASWQAKARHPRLYLALAKELDTDRSLCRARPADRHNKGHRRRVDLNATWYDGKDRAAVPANSAAREAPYLYLLRGPPCSSFCLRGKKLLACRGSPPPVRHASRQRRSIGQHICGSGRAGPDHLFPHLPRPVARINRAMTDASATGRANSTRMSNQV